LHNERDVSTVHDVKVVMFANQTEKMLTNTNVADVV